MDKMKLAAKAVRGDEEAFLALMDAERHRMSRIAAACLHNESDVLEAIQETVCRAWLKRRDLRQPEFMSTWLVRILLRVCTDELSRRKRQPAYGRVDEQLEQLGAERFGAKGSMDEAEQIAGRLDMDALIESLEPPYREVIQLKYGRDMTLMDIAAALEKPPGTVKTWLHKALKQLRGQLPAPAPRKEEQHGKRS
ncbi:RNA polymerase subunit sigma [Paenibacillus herberti]|uniref:RNA polymerase subunit sigma n=1 Tax=Paenibacillus herberti TaxID=1619309 RepID=A0A229NYS7_9BACL|nr:RNA polymerase subunit sigma [Paenibacillus herberti]